MYILNLDDRVYFNHGGYGWRGFVTEIHDIDGKMQYMVELKEKEIDDYHWYMKTPERITEVMIHEAEILH